MTTDASTQPRASHPAPARDRAAVGALWFALFGGAAAWAIQTIANLALASHGCFPHMIPLAAPATPGLRGIVFVISLASVAVSAAAILVALRNWRRTRHEHQQRDGRSQGHAPSAALAETGEGRTRFMAMSGVLASVTFLVASVAQLAVVFLVSPCFG
ncbi:MAG TPA: hypothetical protein VII52_09215 [Gemmatimonadaceae bacterium]